MRHVPFLLAVVMAATPVLAQEAPPTGDDAPGLFGEATRDLLREFAERIAPSLEEMQDELAPALQGLAERLRGLDAYHAPEILPNGDILIRRKRPGEEPHEAVDPPGDAVEL